MSFTYRRVLNKDIDQIINLFTVTFNQKISSQYYKKKYYKNKQYSSFVTLHNSKIIGHIGFVKNKINISKYYVYSRHSSMVDINFRKRNIYSELSNYAIKELNNKYLVGIIVNPNTLNKKVTDKIFKISYFDFKELYIFTNKQKNIFKKKHAVNKNIINVFLQNNKIKNFYYKDAYYFYNNYLNSKKRYYYNIYQKNKIIFYNIKTFKQINNYNILDYNFDIYADILNLKLFIKDNVSVNSTVNVWAEKKDYIYKKKLKEIGFISKKQIFNIGILILKNNIYSKYIKKGYINFNMGDIDVFHHIN